MPVRGGIAAAEGHGLGQHFLRIRLFRFSRQLLGDSFGLGPGDYLPCGVFRVLRLSKGGESNTHTVKRTCTTCCDDMLTCRCKTVVNTVSDKKPCQIKLPKLMLSSFSKNIIVKNENTKKSCKFNIHFLLTT